MSTEIEGLKQQVKDAQPLEAIKSGVLMKTSRSRREGSKSGPSRERRFRLTEEGLEYLQPFSHVRCAWKSTLMVKYVVHSWLQCKKAIFGIYSERSC